MSASVLTIKGKSSKIETNYAGKKITRLLGFAPDYWAFYPTTELFYPATGLCNQLLGFIPNY